MDNQIIMCSCFLLLFIINFSKGIDMRCSQSDNTNTKCTSLGECPTLLKLLKTRPIPSESQEHLRQVLCGFIGIHPMVCCPPDDVITTTTIPQTKIVTQPTEFPHIDLLPKLNECGFFFQDRIYIGNETQLDGYPWTALLEYQTPSGNRFHCGGVLINERYVLTAAHCILGKHIEDNWKLVSIRLGEYDRESDRDCDNYLFSQLDCCCADDVINIEIEEQIVHENFDPNSEAQYYDIALLRLTENVRYSDFIKPICLHPASNLAAVSNIGDTGIISGWGVTNTRYNSNKKQWGKLQIRNNTECEAAYSNLRLREDQICAFSIDHSNSCSQDSGGALSNLISSAFQNYYAIGVMSHSHPICGLTEYPVIYTKVENYLDWIISRLRP